MKVEKIGTDFVITMSRHEYEVQRGIIQIGHCFASYYLELFKHNRGEATKILKTVMLAGGIDLDKRKDEDNGG